MTDRVFSITDYNFLPDDELFLDTNIWLKIFCPLTANEPRVSVYSSAFRRILETNCRIYIDVLVVSEFINTYSRILWRHSQTTPGFKEFRNSQQFEPIAQEIASNITRILKHCSRLDNKFDSLKIRDLLDEYSKGSVDFNDQVIGRLCRSRNLKLITDDQDFKVDGISILTANNNLLR